MTAYGPLVFGLEGAAFVFAAEPFKVRRTGAPDFVSVVKVSGKVAFLLVGVGTQVTFMRVTLVLVLAVIRVELIILKWPCRAYKALPALAFTQFCRTDSEQSFIPGTNKAGNETSVQNRRYFDSKDSGTNTFKKTFQLDSSET